MASANDIHSSVEILETDCINGANRLLQMCKLNFPAVTSLSNIGTSFILAVFERICSFSNPAMFHKVEKMMQVHKLQFVIDCLSSELLGLSLSHISAENITAGDSVAILNLIEIMEAIYLHLSSQEVDSAHEGETSPFHNRKVFKRKIHKNSPKKENINLRFRSSDDEKCVNHLKNVYRRKSAKNEKKSENLNNQQSLNFETKVQSFLSGKESPKVKCRSLSQAYWKNQLQSSYKDASICNKSYLLPYNLRKRCCPSKPPKSRKKKATHKRATKEEFENKSVPPDTLQGFLVELPGLHFSSNMENLMTRDYHRHLSFLHKQIKTALLRKPEILRQEQLAKKNQALSSEILSKDLKQRHVLRQVKEEKDLENKIRFKLRDAYLRSARMKVYYNRYHLAMQKKLQQPNIEEELLVQTAFRKMLQHQKEEVRSLCELLKEVDKKDAQHHLQYLEALEKTYQTQFSLLADVVQDEKSKLSDQAKEYNEVSKTRLQKWRSDTQVDIHSLQKNTLAIIKDIHFRCLDTKKFD